MHDDVVTCSDSRIGERGPMRFLMVAWLITVAALFGSVWSAYDSYRQYATTAHIPGAGTARPDCSPG